MSPDQEKKLDAIGEKVSAIHTTIFGHEQQGGIVREVDNLKKEVSEQKIWQAKAATVYGIATAAASAFAAFITGNHK